jgi:hypothetical protein
VHLVGFHYKNISRCAVPWMSNSESRLPTATDFEEAYY